MKSSLRAAVVAQVVAHRGSSGGTSDLGSRGPEFDSFRELHFFLVSSRLVASRLVASRLFSYLFILSYLSISGASSIRSLVVQLYRFFNFPRKNGGLAEQLEVRQKKKSSP